MVAGANQMLQLIESLPPQTVFTSRGDWNLRADAHPGSSRFLHADRTARNNLDGSEKQYNHRDDQP